MLSLRDTNKARPASMGTTKRISGPSTRRPHCRGLKGGREPVAAWRGDQGGRPIRKGSRGVDNRSPMQPPSASRLDKRRINDRQTESNLPRRQARTHRAEANRLHHGLSHRARKRLEMVAASALEFWPWQKEQGDVFPSAQKVVPPTHQPQPGRLASPAAAQRHPPGRARTKDSAAQRPR